VKFSGETGEGEKICASMSTVDSRSSMCEAPESAISGDNKAANFSIQEVAADAEYTGAGCGKDAVLTMIGAG